MKTLLKKSALRSASCLQALALVGAGVGMVAVAAPAVAQDYTNVTASGRVISTDGAAISGATVTIVSESQGFTRTVTTDSNGSYRIAQIPAGDYTFTVDADGFDSFTDTGVELSQNGAANQFALVPVGGVQEIVVMAGRKAVVDFNRTTTGSVINVADLADRVPVGRDLTSILELSPGVASGDSAFGNLASIGGSSVSETQFYVNGLNVTDFRKGLGGSTVPFDFYETIEIKDGGYSAEFGRATGGLINATTKSGSNEYHASIKFNWEPDGLRSDQPSSRVPDENGNPGSLYRDNSLDSRAKKDVIVQLSGPIIKDRLFVYGIYNFRDLESTGGVPTANRYDVLKTDSPFWGAKVDAVPIDGHRLEFTYWDSAGSQVTDSYRYDPETSVIGDYQSAELTEYGGTNYVARYTGTLADWFTVSAAYGQSKLSDNTTATDVNYPYIQDYRSDSSGEIIGNSVNVLETANDKREFYRFDAELYVNLLGTHNIRMGYDNENLTSDNTATYTGNVAYQYYLAGNGDAFAPAGTEYVSARTFISGGVFDTQNEAFYIQDNWSLLNDRLQLKLGLRNDRFTNKNADGEAFYESGNQWGPRLGFTFDVFDDGRAKLYGSFGRYFLPIPSNTNIRLAGAEYDLTRYNVLDGVNADGTPIVGAPLIGFDGSNPCYDTGIDNCENISDGTANPTTALVSQSLKPQSVDEYIVGGEMRVGSDWVLGLYGTYRSLNRSLEDAAIDAAVIDYCDANGIEGCDDIWTGFHQYVLFNPGDAATVVLSDPIGGEATARTVDFTAEQLGYPAAKRTYKGLTFTFEREFDGVWSLQGSYTYSQTKGNIEGGVKSDNGQDDSGITTDFDQPGLTNGAYGFLPNHRAHNFKIFGSYKVTDWFTFGANASVTSPRKYGCQGRIPSSIDPFAAQYGVAAWYCNVDADGNVVTQGEIDSLDNVKLTPRGSVFESDWTTSLNLTGMFKLPIDDFDTSLRIDVFNVFNSSAGIDFEERGTLDNYQPRASYGLPTSWQTPRYVRFQLQMGF